MPIQDNSARQVQLQGSPKGSVTSVTVTWGFSWDRHTLTLPSPQSYCLPFSKRQGTTQYMLSVSVSWRTCFTTWIFERQWIYKLNQMHSSLLICFYYSIWLLILSFGLEGVFILENGFHRGQGNIVEPGKEHTTVTFSNTTTLTMLNTMSFWVNHQFCISWNAGPSVEEGKETANAPQLFILSLSELPISSDSQPQGGSCLPTLLFISLGTKSWLVGSSLMIVLVVIEPEGRVSSSCLKSSRSSSFLLSLLADSYVSSINRLASGCGIKVPIFSSLCSFIVYSSSCL